MNNYGWPPPWWMYPPPTGGPTPLVETEKFIEVMKKLEADKKEEEKKKKESEKKPQLTYLEKLFEKVGKLELFGVCLVLSPFIGYAYSKLLVWALSGMADAIQSLPK